MSFHSTLDQTGSLVSYNNENKLYERRYKVKSYMMRCDLLKCVDLTKLEELAHDLDIDVNSTLWVDYLDIVMDFRSLQLQNYVNNINRLEEVCENFVQILGHNQLVKIRYFFHCIEQISQPTTSSSSWVYKTPLADRHQQYDNLEQIYLKSISDDRQKNYNSLVSLRFGQKTSVYSVSCVHSPDYFINLKLYDLNRSSTQTIANVKFYGNQMYEYDTFKTARHLTMQTINLIERRIIEKE